MIAGDERVLESLRAARRPQRRLLGVGAVLAVLLLWSLRRRFRAGQPDKLPAPWDVLAALAYLSWHDGQSMLLTATCGRSAACSSPACW
jgi:ABC-type nitrate/sulfonate/bicarbonate transport system permease component